jgi:outer membrane protein
MRSLRFVAALAISAQAVLAQQPAGRSSLSLDEAIAIARQNNPNFLTTQSNVRVATSGIRQAYSALLPSVSSSFGTSYQQGGTQFVQGLALGGANGDTYQSSYRLSVNYFVTGAVAFAPRQARANRDAAEADVASSAEATRALVTNQYIASLKSQAQASLADSLVATATGQLDLANAKVKVGAGTIVDIRTAEVAVGQAQVNQVTAHNQAVIDKIRLFQFMGVPADTSTKLTTQFAISQPNFTLDSVLNLARKVNPDIAAGESRRFAADMGVRTASTGYLPSLSVGTGWGGNALSYADANFLVNSRNSSIAQSAASCFSFDSLRTRVGLTALPCGQTDPLTSEQAAAVRAGNNAFPFKFTRNPLSIGATLSFPIFNNYSREAQLEQARVTRDNANYALKARTLQLTTDVTSAYLSLIAAAKTVQLQEQTAQKAAEELAAVEERYRVGAATFLEVTTSRGSYETAQIGRVNSIYDYHTAFANLESAVGRPLR